MLIENVASLGDKWKNRLVLLARMGVKLQITMLSQRNPTWLILMGLRCA